MPGANKASCNSFYMFMLHYKAREERKGVRFSRGIESVVQPAGEEWRRMSSDEKAVFKDKAREYKTSAEFRQKKRRNWNQTPKPKTQLEKQKSQMLKNPSSTDEEEFLDDAESIFYDQEEDGRLKRKRELQLSELKRALTWNVGTDLERRIFNESFYIMSVQNYFETPEHQYSPAEIAFVEFSLARGIIKHFHAILKPMYVPQNLRNRVISTASNTHRILVSSLPMEARDDYRNIVNEIKKFYVNQKNYGRIFVLLKQLNSVQGAAKALRDKVNSKQFVPSEMVMCVEDLFTLFCEMRQVTPERSDLDGFDQIFDQCGWDYDPNTLCFFHHRGHSKHCAIAIARKACYYIFTKLKDAYQLNITSAHIPMSVQQTDFHVPSMDDQLLAQQGDDGSRAGGDFRSNNDIPSADTSFDQQNYANHHQHLLRQQDDVAGTLNRTEASDFDSLLDLYPDMMAQLSYSRDDNPFLDYRSSASATLNGHQSHVMNQEQQQQLQMQQNFAGILGNMTAPSTSHGTAAALTSDDEYDLLARARLPHQTMTTTTPTVPDGVANVRWQTGPYDYERAQLDAQLQQDKKRVNRALFQNGGDCSFETEDGNNFVLKYTNAYSAPTEPSVPQGFTGSTYRYQQQQNRRYQRSGSNVSTDDNLQSTADAMASLNVSYNSNNNFPLPQLQSYPQPLSHLQPSSYPQAPPQSFPQAQPYPQVQLYPQNHAQPLPYSQNQPQPPYSQNQPQAAYSQNQPQPPYSQNQPQAAYSQAQVQPQMLPQQQHQSQAYSHLSQAYSHASQAYSQSQTYLQPPSSYSQTQSQLQSQSHVQSYPQPQVQATSMPAYLSTPAETAYSSPSGRMPTTKALCSRFLIAPVPK